MKKNILFFAMMLLLCSTCISTFANNPDNDIITLTGSPDNPVRKSPHMPYIIDSMDNGVCSLTFLRAFNNAEIKVYQNGFLIDQNSRSFKEGETYTLDLQGYGKGEYTIEVYYSGNKIFSSSEEL